MRGSGEHSGTRRTADAATLVALRDRILTSAQFTQRDSRIARRLLEILFQAFIDGKPGIHRRELAIRCYQIKRADVISADTQKIGTGISRLRKFLEKYFTANSSSEPLAVAIATDGDGYCLTLTKQEKAKIEPISAIWGPYLSAGDPTFIALFGLPFGLPGIQIGTPTEGSAVLNQLIRDFLRGVLHFTKLLHEKRCSVWLESFDMVWEKPDAKHRMWSHNLLIATTTDDHLRQSPLWASLKNFVGHSTASDGVVRTFGGKTLSSYDKVISATHHSYAVVKRFQYKKNTVKVITSPDSTTFGKVMWYLTDSAVLRELTSNLAPLHEGDRDPDSQIERIVAWQLVFDVHHDRHKFGPSVRPIETVLFNKQGYWRKWVLDPDLDRRGKSG